jgi:RNA polymerase sigma-70 factor, ECF subfamily
MQLGELLARHTSSITASGKEAVIVQTQLATAANQEGTRRVVPIADRSGFDRLIAPLLEPAYRLAFAILRQREAAEDAVQEATLKAWYRIDQFRGEGGGIRAWYFAIVANECRSVRRGSWQSVLHFWGDSTTPGNAEATMAASELRQSIARLKHADRVLLYLYYWLDLPLEEVGAIVGVSASAAKARLYRAVGRLRLQLDPTEELTR